MSKKSQEKINSVIGLLQYFEEGKLRLKEKYNLAVVPENDKYKSFSSVTFSSFYYSSKDETDSVFYFTNENDKSELSIDKRFFEGENGLNGVYLQLEMSC